MNPGKNSGLTPFSSDPRAGKPAGSRTAASGRWRQSEQVDFQGNNLLVSPTDTPFWNGLGSALDGLVQTLGFTVRNLFKP